MTSLPPRQPRFRLDADSYRRLSRQVLERDGWRCQNCGRSNELQIHHIISRSHLGNDREENLITLCANCHREFGRSPNRPSAQLRFLM
ncbi:HNH endonuclease [Acidobacteriia bacterium AH_259_A11_L15]|nr:HNH endonuclease [Acidobacteriia bacterium AH_259_A11_L15]